MCLWLQEKEETLLSRLYKKMDVATVDIIGLSVKSRHEAFSLLLGIKKIRCDEKGRV